MKIEDVAKLARIDLSAQEKAKYSKQFEQILGYMEKLNKVKTTGVATADGGTRDLANVWRRDQLTTNNSQLTTKNLIEMAPDKEKGQIKVKAVF